MARWILVPDWGDNTAQLLHTTLQEAFWNARDLEQIWIGVGMPPAQIDWQQPAAALWPALTRDAWEAQRLEQLIREVRDRRPAVAVKLDRVLAAENIGVGWYAPQYRHQALLLGPGCRRAMLDRVALRHHLLKMLHEQYPVLAITGGPAPASRTATS